MQEIIASSEKIGLMRKTRKKLEEMIKNKEKEIKEVLKNNLDIFNYIINVDYKNICDTTNLEEHFNLLIANRIESVSKETYKQILSMYELLIIPCKNSSPFSYEKKNQIFLDIENLLKFLFCIQNFYEKSEVMSDTYFYFNLISLECVFMSQNEILSKTNPITLEWDISLSIQELFKENIKINFNSEDLNIFVMKKKLDLFLKYIKNFMNFPLETLKYFNSILLPKNFSVINLIKEKDVNLVDSEEIIKDFFKKVEEILLKSDIPEESKAFIFSYMIVLNKGIAVYADTSYFRGKDTYYFVKWIDIFKKEMNY